MINMDLIETTYQEIGTTYRPGLIAWLKRQPDRWARLRILEDRIDQAALAREGIVEALAAYQRFFDQQSADYAEALPLFGGSR